MKLPDLISNAGVRGASNLLAGMRVRRKLIVLHTFFSLLLAGVLAMTLWPAITRILEASELDEAKLALSLVQSRIEQARADGREPETVIAEVRRDLPPGVLLARGKLDEFGWPSALGKVHDASMVAGRGWGRLADGAIAAWYVDRADNSGVVATARLEPARAAVGRLYVLVTLALLVVYGLIAAALELFILPRHVYEPIRQLLLADRAVQEGREDEALVPTEAMPADELGEIMRSRNRTILALRKHEQELAKALAELATTATDLKRKNHLLENAQRNLADADRLASLGMMSAGLAHELNTPLAVAKGLVEKMISRADRQLEEAEAALLLRVVGRLERLSESLLDFARVRPPRTASCSLAPLVDEAWTLVRLDRESRRVEFLNAVAPEQLVCCDADRMVQVLVNLLRNAVDAIDSGGRPAGAGAAPSPPQTSGGFPNGAPPRGTIQVEASQAQREGREWVSITITDDGPGMDAEILGRLFEPFATTRLDSRGTGLGLAVSDGIVREHGGVLLARNRRSTRGSVFEIMLPVGDQAGATAPAELASAPQPGDALAAAGPIPGAASPG